MRYLLREVSTRITFNYLQEIKVYQELLVHPITELPVSGALSEEGNGSVVSPPTEKMQFGLAPALIAGMYPSHLFSYFM